MKFKVINESLNKTDRHDANTLSLVFTKERVLEIKLCECESKDLRADLMHRKICSSHSKEREIKNATISLKNQAHCTMLENGIETRSNLTV